MCVVLLLFMLCASYHVDTPTQERPLTEAPEPEVEYNQEQQQESEQEPSEVADQEQEQDLTNSANPQGKHRCIPTPCPTSVKFIFYNLCI